MKCECTELKLNGQSTGQKTINAGCPQHGIGTEYWSRKFSQRYEIDNQKKG